MSRLVWAIPALLLLLPTVSAEREIQRFEVVLDHDRPMILNEVVYTGTDASSVRHQMPQATTASGDPQQEYSWSGEHDASCMQSFNLFAIEGASPRRLVAYTARYESLGEHSEDPVVRFETFTYEGPGSEGTVPATVDLSRLDLDRLGRRCVPPQYQVFVHVSVNGGRAPTISDTAILRIAPASGMALDARSVEPADVRSLWRPSGFQADDAEGRARMFQAITVPLGPKSVPASNEPFLGAPITHSISWSATIGVGSLLGLGLLLGTEAGRLQGLRFLAAIGLYSRLSRDEVLEHGRRDELFQLLRHHPEGPSLADLRRITGFTHGTIVHHLRMLEQKGLVLAVRDGFRTRFFLRGPRVVPQPYLTPVQQQLLQAVRESPGVTQKDLSVRLNLPREAVSYHARRLQDAGALEIRATGRARRHYVRLEATPALPTPVVATG